MTESTPSEPDPLVLSRDELETHVKSVTGDLSDGDCERLWRMLSEPGADGQLAALDRAVERMRAAEAKLAAIAEHCRTRPELAGAGYPALAADILAIIGTEEEGRGHG